VEDPTDADVILASCEEPERFGVLFDRYATTLHRYFLRRVGPDDAEGLMADTFRIAFERRGSYDVGRPFARPWLYGIATNLLARQHRSAARREAAVARLAVAVHESPVDWTDGTVAAIDATRSLRDVVDAIDELPPGERDVLMLYAWEQLGYEDVADALDIPVGTVRSRLSRARAKLRELAAVHDEPLVHAQIYTREKERLMTSITGTERERLEHGSRMYPRLAYRDEHAALEYLTRVFGFTERREARVGGATPDDDMLAWLEFGEGLVMIGHANEDVHMIASPLDRGGSTTMINVEVDDVDAHYARAVEQGATITFPLEDAWYGSRRYEASDLEGHRWHFDETFEHIRARGGSVPDA
jgi:RNA polymerase sigma factor (sigma-70 family)